MDNSPNPTPPPVPTPGRTPEISDTQAETVTTWITNDLEIGRITPEQARKAFDELNTPPEQRAPDTRTDEIKG